MKKYICKKACTLNGTQVAAGEAIPHDLLVANRIPKLVSMGLIEEAPAWQPEPAQAKPSETKARETSTPEEKPVKEPLKPAKRQPAKSQKAGD